MIPRKSAAFSMKIPDLDKKIRVLRVLAPKAFDRGLEAGIRAATIDVTAEVKDLLDGPVLNRRSNRLWRSIQPEVYRRAGTIVGIIGTDVEYAAIHEFGGTIRGKEEGGYLSFRVGDDFVRVREVEMPKRPYMSRAFKKKQAKIGRLIRSHVLKSVKGTLKTGRVKAVDRRVGVGFDAD